MNQQEYAQDTAIKAGKQETAMYCWFILALVSGLHTINNLVVSVVSPLAPFIMSDLGLTKAMLGLAGGIANIGIAITAIVFGKLADQRGERLILMLGSVMTGLGIIITSRVGSYYALLAGLFFTGMWYAAQTPAGSKAIRDWYPPRRLGFALGVKQTGIPLGGFIGALLFPFLALNWGWRVAMIAAGTIAIASGVLFYVWYRERQGTPNNSGTNIKQNKGVIMSILRDWNFMLLQVTTIFYVGAQFVMVTYLILFLHDVVGFSIVVAGMCLAVSQLGGIFGRIFLGLLSDSFFKGARRPIMLITGVLLILVLLVLTRFDSNTPFWLAAVVSWFFGMAALGWNAIELAFVMKMVKPEQGATAVGVTITVMQLGVLLIPPMFGAVVDLTGSYSLGFLIVAGLVFLGVLTLLSLRESTP